MFLLISSTCFAQTKWCCNYVDGRISLDCFLLQGSSSNKQVDPKLPKIMTYIVNNPEELKLYTIKIPMYTVPYDMEFVRLLGDSVMCYSKTHYECEVIHKENATCQGECHK